MNERIRELAEQALEYAEKNQSADIPRHWFRLYNEKFAELIVRECVDLALSEQKRYAELTHRDMSECAVAMSNFGLVMAEHFGVEK
jgi:hypothetical protein